MRNCHATYHYPHNSKKCQEPIPASRFGWRHSLPPAHAHVSSFAFTLPPLRRPLPRFNRRAQHADREAPEELG